MTKRRVDERPDNHSVEHEMIRVPAKEGEPPRPATTPPTKPEDERGR